MVAGMKTPLLWEKVDPLPIVSRHPHLCRIAMKQIRSALIERRRMEIVRIKYMRIIIKTLPIMGMSVGICHLLTESVLCRSGI